MRQVVVIRGCASRSDTGPMGRAWWCWLPSGRIARGEYAYLHLELHWLCFFLALFFLSRRWYDEGEP
jgi:hypothetical protein